VIVLIKEMLVNFVNRLVRGLNSSCGPIDLRRFVYKCKTNIILKGIFTKRPDGVKFIIYVC
jgi:hypothetical protein